MRFHIDPVSAEVTKCNNLSCSLFPEQAHYYSFEEATESLALSRMATELIELSSINFNRARSSKNDSYFLEATLRTPLDENVHFTIENFEDHSVGSILLGAKEYALARNSLCLTDEDFEKLAKETVYQARKMHRLDIWPSQAVIALYRDFSNLSSPTEIKSNGLRLQELESPGLTQIYRGETAIGTEISLRAAYGYAVAEIIKEDGPEMIYEAGITRQIFTHEQERNSFAARAFGELLTLGEI